MCLPTCFERLSEPAYSGADMAETAFEKVVLITRKTRLDELVERFNTRAQAKFYIEHAGGDFSAYVLEHDAYQRSLETVKRSIETGLKIQAMDRSLAPTYVFSKSDVVVTLGQDGLVANAPKYVGGQPILAVNPDPERFDGILLPFAPEKLRAGLERTLAGRTQVRSVTLAEAKLKDGQRLLAFNDLFIGAGTHVSARYRIRYGDQKENHSSSGVIVSTGAGSTGWLSSIFNETSGIVSFLGGANVKPVRMDWEESKLLFVVREPFVSRHSQATIVAGTILPHAPLAIESQMPNGGVIFSDGIEADHLDFNSGAIANIRIAAEKANLVVA
jgi:NAD kinase